MIVQIENTNICNAKCVFCAHRFMKRTKGMMEQSVFENIIADCSTFNLLDGVWITGIGEPLLDPNIVDKVKHIRSVLGKRMNICIYTNGTNLDKYLDKLMKAGLSDLYISLNAVNSEKRKSLMGIDGFKELDEIITNWKYDKAQLWVSLMPDFGLMERGDVVTAQERYRCGNVYFHYASNWAGKIFDLKFKPTEACPRLWTYVHFLWDGRIALCCLDCEGDVILGNKIEHFLKGEKANFYRSTMKDGKRYSLPLCGNCATV